MRNSSILFLCNATISFQKHSSHVPDFNAVIACESKQQLRVSFSSLLPPGPPAVGFVSSMTMACDSAYCTPTERADGSCEFHHHPVPVEPPTSAVYQWHQPGIQGTGPQPLGGCPGMSWPCDQWGGRPPHCGGVIWSHQGLITSYTGSDSQITNF